MHAASRAVLLVAFAGIAACTGTVPAQNAGMPPAAAESVTEEPAAADAELLNTYWKILALAGEPVSVAPGKREPHVILRSTDGRDSWSATVGCNSMSGALAVNGNRIEFKSGISTLIACPPPLDAHEKALTQSLTASTQWRIEGSRLELVDGAGTQTLLCEAVYLE
jgi:heat shock protein HslJ